MKNLFYLFFFCSLSGCVSDSEPISQDPFPEISSWIDEQVQSNQFSGAVIIGNQTEILYQKYTGLASRVWNVPIDSNTRFDIASLNKSFVGGLVMLAQEQGKLNVNDKLIDWLKAFDYSGRFNDQITIHHLLTHTSGLADYGEISPELAANQFANFKRKRFSNSAYVDFISQLDPVGKPEEQFYYSNFAYHLLCIILETAYERPFSEILEKKICDPLNMKSTFNTTSNEVIYKNVAEGYNPTKVEEQWTRNQFIDLTLGRRIFASATDLYQWGAAMTDNRLLSASARAEIQQNHIGAIEPQIAYGYGWVVYGEKEKYGMGDLGLNQPYLIHGGKTEGYKAMLVVLEKGEYVISILANCGSKMDEMAFTQEIVNLLKE